MTASPIVLFILIFALSVPFYVLGTAGGRMPSIPMLPASALMAFVPMIAALVLVYRQRGASAAAALLKSAVDISRLDFNSFRCIAWILIALLFMPAVCVAELAVLCVSGSTLPIPQIASAEMLFLFATVFISAIGEELGWQGYAYPGLISRLNALNAALVPGVVWALWHVIPFVQLGRGADWIFWHSMSAVAMRVVIVWLFENTGKSVVVAVLFHTIINLTWALFTISESFYDPFITVSILAASVALIAMVYQLWILTSWPFNEG